MSPDDRLETATLGGGCFWCLEAVYDRVRGVEDVVPGYAGGHAADPTYREVCSGTTGHAEVVRIRFDPETIAYRELLDVFFAIHDPTTKDREGPDVGSQYRSIILWESESQRDEARAAIRELEEEGRYADPIVTEVEPLDAFHPAEEEHHDFYRRNRDYPYCRVVIDPKVRKLLESFPERAVDGG